MMTRTLMTSRFGCVTATWRHDGDRVVVENTDRPERTRIARMRSVVVVLTGSLLFAPSVGAEEPGEPAPAGATIAKIDVKGSGCRGDSAAVALSPDRRAFTITYSEFLAQAGGDARGSEQRRDCRMTIKVSVPSGFTFGVTGIDHRGYAQLAKGAHAEHRGTYDFGDARFGRDRAVRGDSTLKGPMDGEWQGRTAAERGLVMAPCGQANTVNVSSELLVNAGPSARTTTSYVTMDSTDGDFRSVFSWAWGKCGGRRR
jgi:hypothetical protein